MSKSKLNGELIQDRRFKLLQNQVGDHRGKWRSHWGTKRLLIDTIVKMEKGGFQDKFYFIPRQI